MDRASPLAGSGSYPEREDARESAADRWVAGLGFRIRNLLRREARNRTGLADDVARHASRYSREPLAASVIELRYRLRRDGLHPERVAECFGLCSAAMSPGATAVAAPEILAAAELLLHGRMVELSDPDARRQALAYAALARAIEGVPVHVVCASAAGARRAADIVRAPLALLGMEAGCVVPGMDARMKRAAYAAPVVCGAHRDIGIDYLRDRLLAGGKLRPLASSIERLAGGAEGAQPLLRGLHCALVDEADVVLLDEASQPLAISGDSDHAAERLLYEQALELARALALGVDYEHPDEGALLTEEGAQRIARLVGPLGGVWAARQRREELVVLALKVLHRLQPGRDYRVEQGRVIVLGRSETDPGDVTETDQILQHLVEVKEGCRLSVRRDVLVRLSAPRFLGRYLRLSGICADATGIEQELWSMYSLSTTRAGPPPVPVACIPRLFRTAVGRRAALIAGAQSCVARGESVVIAVRTTAEARGISGALKEAGLNPVLVPGTGEPAERQAIASLAVGGGVVVAHYPADRQAARAGGGPARLRLLVAELHDARRHVERLARAFAADTCEMLLSLEDEIVVQFLGSVAVIAARIGGANGDELPPERSRWLAGLAQRRIERAGALMRQEMMSRDRHLDDLLAFSGRRE